MEQGNPMSSNEHPIVLTNVGPKSNAHVGHVLERVNNVKLNSGLMVFDMAK